MANIEALYEYITEGIQRLVEESQAAKQAHALGLVSAPYGQWKDPKTDKVVAKSVDDGHGGTKLVKINTDDDFGADDAHPNVAAKEKPPEIAPKKEPHVLIGPQEIQNSFKKIQKLVLGYVETDKVTDPEQRSKVEDLIVKATIQVLQGQEVVDPEIRHAIKAIIPQEQVLELRHILLYIRKELKSGEAGHIKSVSDYFKNNPPKIEEPPKPAATISKPQEPPLAMKYALPIPSPSVFTQNAPVAEPTSEPQAPPQATATKIPPSDYLSNAEKMIGLISANLSQQDQNAWKFYMQKAFDATGQYALNYSLHAMFKKGLIDKVMWKKLDSYVKGVKGVTKLPTTLNPKKHLDPSTGALAGHGGMMSQEPKPTSTKGSKEKKGSPILANKIKKFRNTLGQPGEFTSDQVKEMLVYLSNKINEGKPEYYHSTASSVKEMLKKHYGVYWKDAHRAGLWARNMVKKGIKFTQDGRVDFKAIGAENPASLKKLAMIGSEKKMKAQMAAQAEITALASTTLVEGEEIVHGGQHSNAHQFYKKYTHSEVASYLTNESVKHSQNQFKWRYENWSPKFFDQVFKAQKTRQTGGTWNNANKQLIYETFTEAIEGPPPAQLSIKHFVERGMSISKTSLKAFLGAFKIGERAYLSPSGFSEDPQMARQFASSHNAETSTILMRILPNKKTGTLKALSLHDWQEPGTVASYPIGFPASYSSGYVPGNYNNEKEVIIGTSKNLMVKNVKKILIPIYGAIQVNYEIEMEEVDDEETPVTEGKILGLDAKNFKGMSKDTIKALFKYMSVPMSQLKESGSNNDKIK